MGTITCYLFENLSKHPNLIHGVTTRHGGVSGPPFSSLNTSFAVGDDRESVIANRKLIGMELGIPYSALVVARQVHGTNVAVIGETPWPEQPEEWHNILPDADALITSTPGRALMMTFADCVPILLYDPINHAVGIAHGGWRGTVGKVAERVIEAMSQSFGSDPAKLIAAVGPSIGPCCYEVGDEVNGAVRDAFANSDDLLIKVDDESTHFDLWKANRSQLLRMGIPGEQIEVAGICTACHTEVFFSHRGERGKTGRFAVVIGLKSSYA